MKVREGNITAADGRITDEKRYIIKTEEKEDKRIFILSKEKPVKAVVKLGVPLIAGMFIMVLYNLVDTYFIGLMRDDFQLAAVNIAYPVMMVMIAISNMIGAGASSLIARSLGAKDTDKAAHTLTAGFLLTVINSAIVTHRPAALEICDRTVEFNNV